jgi:signal transduction histidine kinase
VAPDERGDDLPSDLFRRARKGFRVPFGTGVTGAGVLPSDGMGGPDRVAVVSAVLAAASITVDGVVLTGGTPYAEGTFLAGKLGLAEPLALLVLTVVVVRRSRSAAAAAGGTLTALAVPLWLLRFGPPTWSAPSMGGYTAWATVTAITVAVGLYLRALDEGRNRAAAAARRAQRLELADDLHDFVVHDINEMLLQAQAGQILVEGAATATGVGDVLRRIEHTALRALTTVDRTIDVLHSGSGESAAATGVDGTPRLPKPTVDNLPELVDRFTATGPTTVHLDLDPRLTPAGGAPPPLPPEVATTVYRIVAEALTNVRRHAVDARQVRVTVADSPGGSIRVEIADDGRAHVAHAASRRGGHGLVGLAARVTALGGTLHSGPARTAGWRITAVLPVPSPPAASTTVRR